MMKKISHKIREELTTIRDYIRYAMSLFNEYSLHYGHGTDNAYDEAVALVLQALHLPIDTGDFVLEAALTNKEKIKIHDYLNKRIFKRKPLPFITGKAYFANLEFMVNEKVLIPTSPLAEVIENGFDFWLTEDKIQRVLDIGTGSGAIAVAMAIAYPDAAITAVDISKDALKVANHNAKLHGADEHINFVKSDLFNKLDGEKFDIIISNPPYVPLKSYKNLPKEYSYEPKLALYAEDLGLAVVDRILKQANKHLTDEGILVVEVGEAHEQLRAKYPDLPFMWLDLERGGEGVFLLQKKDLPL